MKNSNQKGSIVPAGAGKKFNLLGDSIKTQGIKQEN